MKTIYFAHFLAKRSTSKCFGEMPMAWMAWPVSITTLYLNEGKETVHVIYINHHIKSAKQCKSASERHEFGGPLAA